MFFKKIEKNVIFINFEKMKENTTFFSNKESSELYFKRSEKTKTKDFFRKRNNSDDFSMKNEKILFKLEPISSFLKNPLQ